MGREQHTPVWQERACRAIGGIARKVLFYKSEEKQAREEALQVEMDRLKALIPDHWPWRPCPFSPPRPRRPRSAP
jgi:hypothetical protein